MTQNVALDKGNTASEPFFDAVQELLSGAAPNITLTVISATTIRVASSTGSDQSSISVNGRYRFRTSNVDATAAGAAATYDIYVTASNNDFSGPPEDIDAPTVYDFGLSIRAIGSPPVGVDQYRKVGELDWDGSAITALRQFVGQRRDDAPVSSVAPRPTITPVRGKGAASQTAPLLLLEDSTGADKFTVAADGSLPQGLTITHADGLILSANGGKDTLSLSNTTADVGLTIGGDVNLFRSSANVLATDDRFDAALDITARTNGATEVGFGAKGPGGEAGFYLGSAADTVVYRSAANMLRTPDSMIIDGTLEVTGGIIGGTVSSGTGQTLTGTGKSVLSFSDTTTTTGLTIGGDTNLYRLSANILMTDDTFYASGDIVGNVGTHQVQMYDSNARAEILFGNAGDTNLYRAGANVLQTDDGFTAAGLITAVAGLSVGDATNIVLGTTTGTQIGTGASQKLSFYGVTPTVQQANATDLKDVLIALGLIASGTNASPLNLDGGSLTAGTTSLGTTSTGGLTAGATSVTSLTSSGGVIGTTGAFSGALSTGAALTITGNLDHDGSNIGFFGVAPVARQGATTDLKDALTNYGLLQGTSASPLDLDGGAISSGSITLTDGSTIIVGTGTGTKIGTSASQKLGFFNATPVVQASSTADIKDVLANLGFLVNGGATPLNLDGGAITSGGVTASGAVSGTSLAASGAVTAASATISGTLAAGATTITGALSATTTINAGTGLQIGGVAIAATNLSDNSDLFRLAGTQTASGAKTFSGTLRHTGSQFGVLGAALQSQKAALTNSSGLTASRTLPSGFTLNDLAKFVLALREDHVAFGFAA